MGRSIFVVGHSHVGAIRRAAQARREAGSGAPPVRTLAVLDPRFGGEFDEGGTRFSPGAREEIARVIARHAPLVASALIGNMHTVLSLVEEDRPFDFILPDEPSPKLNPRADILPVEAIETRLRDAMSLDLRRLDMMRDAAGPFVQLESPPPVAARSFIARRIEPFFSDKPEFARNGIAPGGVRYRMWRLSCRIIERHVRALGGTYLPCPPEMFDAAGFLDQRFAVDSTHGNDAFGEAMIVALEGLRDQLRSP